MKYNYNPLVSIVIPVYNGANYLREAIDSALAQTYENIEIIVINDGSTDSGQTEEIALSYGDKIRYFYKPNGGSSSALNEGIRQMKGEWFSWLSHDDLYLPDKVDEQIKYINNCIGINTNLYNHVIFTASELINKDKKLVSKPSVKKIDKIASEVLNIENNCMLIANPDRFNFHGCSSLIHKQVFLKVGMFDEHLRLLNDYDMWFRIYASNYKLHYIPKILVQGRMHANQVSREIEFSYQNPEQDMYWKRSLQWLKENCSNDSKVFQTFAKVALSKTRVIEGNEALRLALRINPKKKYILVVNKLYLILKSKTRMLLKQIYIKLFL